MGNLLTELSEFSEWIPKLRRLRNLRYQTKLRFNQTSAMEFPLGIQNGKQVTTNIHDYDIIYALENQFPSQYVELWKRQVQGYACYDFLMENERFLSFYSDLIAKDSRIIEPTAQLEAHRFARHIVNGGTIDNFEFDRSIGEKMIRVLQRGIKKEQHINAEG